MPDFFGNEGVDPFGNNSVRAPAKTIEQMQEEERQRIEANRVRGLDANGNPLPAYGTPIRQGGTAQGYQVTQQVPIGTGAMSQTSTVPLGNTDGLPIQGATGREYTKQTAGFNPGVRASDAFTVQTSPLSLGNAAGNGVGGPGGAGGAGAPQGDQMAAGEGLAEEVLSSQPSVDPANKVTAANRDALTPFMDPALADTQNTQRALDMSQDLVNRITGAPLQSELLADQMLGNQLLLARSARGGAGAVQDALNNAQAQAPELQRVASQQMTQEQVARAGAAGQAASIYAGVATNDANRAERIAAANQNAGLQVLNNLTTLTGFDYQFDAAKMNAVGQLARDFFNNAAQFAQMDTQLQIAQWNNMTQRYGIDATLKAAMEKIAADEGIGPLDAFKLVLGAASGAASLGAAL